MKKKLFSELEKEHNIKYVCSALTKSKTRLQEVNAYLKGNNMNISIGTKRRYSKETITQNIALSLETAIVISNSLNEIFDIIPKRYIIKANNRIKKSNYSAVVKVFD